MVIVVMFPFAISKYPSLKHERRPELIQLIDWEVGSSESSLPIGPASGEGLLDCCLRMNDVMVGEDGIT